MGIFDFLKPQEEQYYLKFKKMFTSKDRNKITISVLRVRVMTIQNVIDNLTENYHELQEEIQKSIIVNDIKLFKKNSEKRDDLKLKLTVLFRIQPELKNDFIRGATIKLKEMGYNEIPLNYEGCNRLSNQVSNEHWNLGRYISDEKIDGYKHND